MNPSNNFNPQPNMSNEEIDPAVYNKLKGLNPQIKPDKQFASLLRSELAEKAQALSPRLDKSINKPLTFFSFMNKVIIPIVAVAIVAAGTGYWYANNNSGLIGLDGNQLLSDKIAVTELTENSFGDLDKVQIVADNRSNGQGGSGGGSNLTASAEADKMAAPGYGGGGSFAPVPNTTKYEYVGKAIDNLPENHGVLQRLKPSQPVGLFNRIIRFFSFGLIDLTKMQNATVQSISFLEDKEYGLNVNVDLNYGSVNIYQNWEKWPQPRYECYGYQCGPQPPLNIRDIPSDSEAVEIADKFLAEYSISREGYADGQVVDFSNWRILYEQAEDKSTIYLPEQVQVIYPLQLSGQTVYDEGGNLSGMNVTVDVRSRKVSGVYGLETKQFEKSSYVGETDVKRIMEMALRGGYRNYDYPYVEGENKSLKLDTPKIQLVRMWYTKDINKQGEDLYVPSLVFPIINSSELNYWRKNVIVPLVKDILDNENIYGNPVPMPVDIPVEQPAEDTTGAEVQPVTAN